MRRSVSLALSIALPAALLAWLLVSVRRTSDELGDLEGFEGLHLQNLDDGL